MFDLVDQPTADLERFASMRGAHRRNESDIADAEVSDAVTDSEGVHALDGGELASDLREHLGGSRMPLVLQRDDSSAVVVVSDDSAEHDACTGRRKGDGTFVRADVQWIARHRDKHDPAIGTAHDRAGFPRQATHPPTGRLQLATRAETGQSLLRTRRDVLTGRREQ
jgi:hypothetical protein